MPVQSCRGFVHGVGARAARTWGGGQAEGCPAAGHPASVLAGGCPQGLGGEGVVCRELCERQVVCQFPGLRRDLYRDEKKGALVGVRERESLVLPQKFDGGEGHAAERWSVPCREPSCRIRA